MSVLNLEDLPLLREALATASPPVMQACLLPRSVRLAKAGTTCMVCSLCCHVGSCCWQSPRLLYWPCRIQVACWVPLNALAMRHCRGSIAAGLLPARSNGCTAAVEGVTTLEHRDVLRLEQVWTLAAVKQLKQSIQKSTLLIDH